MEFCQSQAFLSSCPVSSGGVHSKYYMNVVINSMKLQGNYKIYLYLGPLWHIVAKGTLTGLMEMGGMAGAPVRPPVAGPCPYASPKCVVLA